MIRGSAKGSMEHGSMIRTISVPARSVRFTWLVLLYQSPSINLLPKTAFMICYQQCSGVRKGISCALCAMHGFHPATEYLSHVQHSLRLFFKREKHASQNTRIPGNPIPGSWLGRWSTQFLLLLFTFMPFRGAKEAFLRSYYLHPSLLDCWGHSISSGRDQFQHRAPLLMSQ